MRIGTFWYCLEQSTTNICRNVWFSLVSIVTISTCIFLFCLFFSLIVDIQHMVKMAGTTIGITVFFDEGTTGDKISMTGSQIQSRPEVESIEFTSTEEAREMTEQDYFKGSEDLAEGFAQDNPLANSASYQIFLNDISYQGEVVAHLQQIEGVRRVNYSNTATGGLSNFNRVIVILSVMIVGALLAVAIFLISNTINVAAAFRKNENEVMRPIGATNYMIQAPFMVKGVILGAMGAVLPLVAMFFLHRRSVVYLLEEFQILSGIFQSLPVETIFPCMAGTTMVLGVKIGFFVSFFTICKHLKVWIREHV